MADQQRQSASASQDAKSIPLPQDNSSSIQDTTQATMELQPLSKPLPVEIWLKIYAYLHPPRILKFQSVKHNSTPMCLKLAPDIDRIPRNLYLNSSMVAELRKTHSVSFQGLAEKPVLFDRKHDVLMFTSLGSMRPLSSSHHSLTLKRELGVQYIAITFFSEGTPYETSDAVMECVWRFASVRKLFLLMPNVVGGPSEKQIEELRVKIEKHVGRAYEIEKTKWEKRRGIRYMTGVRWRNPKVIVVKSEREMLKMVEEE